MGEAASLPPRAYVPGRTARHPEGSFDAVRDSVRAGMTAGDLAQSAAFRHGLGYMDRGYFWEAHEVLEPVWIALPDSSAERIFVQGLIQLANARLKERMARPKAVLRLCAIAGGLLREAERRGGDRIMGCLVRPYLHRVDSLQASIELQYNAHELKHSAKDA